ncbi:LOW QUALITY PROTEIN: hypothetical protein SPRG_17908 [Saprolegnia parasitica CBS 223.65]|uniref:Uncharacterized protein n=1 Tax=Saprolegnia parasitica (strain CBS 223.65) TaxID=695850 RepID=A0A067BEM4_SAPPC|nr:LOW QUALITY PROTEIN: hypothetical protein SPRG_17908 [Saprolegnia parasitica CBS 223.65]KDO16578.1 LOW QUALITY PROTEIN: hypothetical protein SPRG_17908 [Saprolegnia parasitica CBS 223.65]|eukprot:XP_012212714.1 LOW QUALITY PROTEIN: hypothetical protein SPRG_17908 [Saprolegnia parasitica CBS 223.65]
MHPVPVHAAILNKRSHDSFGQLPGRKHPCSGAVCLGTAQVPAPVSHGSVMAMYEPEPLRRWLASGLLEAGGVVAPSETPNHALFNGGSQIGGSKRHLSAHAFPADRAPGDSIWIWPLPHVPRRAAAQP